MKKLSVHLTILCLLALLLVPFAGCKRDENGEVTPATTDTMGTDTMTTEPMTTESTPPAGQ